MQMSAPWEWTPEEEATLRRMWASGAKVREIAEAIGCTMCMVEGKRTRMELPGRHKGRKLREAMPAKADYWSSLARADDVFAEAMAGRTFTDATVSDDRRRLSRAGYVPPIAQSTMAML